MNYRMALLALSLLLFSLPGASVAQESNPFINLPVEVLAETWLTRNCGVDDEPLLEIAVTRQGSALQPLFISAWREGAPDATLRETREAASARFERNRRALDDPKGLGLSTENLERARKQTEDAFVSRAVDSFDTEYRSQALRGLYFAGGDEGRQILEQAAADAQSPFSSAARIVLKRDDAQ
jgi:hypothetical protein